MCITLCKTNKNWDYGELQKYFEINKEKNIEDMMCDLDIKEKSYIRKLKERTQRVTKDSLRGKKKIDELWWNHKEGGGENEQGNKKNY